MAILRNENCKLGIECSEEITIEIRLGLQFKGRPAFSGMSREMAVGNEDSAGGVGKGLGGASENVFGLSWYWRRGGSSCANGEMASGRLRRDVRSQRKGTSD